jgi:excisionase family DNA binding protein
LRRYCARDWWNVKRLIGRIFLNLYKPNNGFNGMDAKLTIKEAAALFTDPLWAEKYPPLLNVEQAADLLKVPRNTIYAWSSQGLLDACKVRAGKHLRLLRDRLIQTLSEGKLHGNG